MNKKRVACAFAAGALGLSAALGGMTPRELGSYIDEPVVDRATAPPPGMVTFGGRISDDLSDGFVDFLVPLWRPGNGLLYFNPRIWGNDAEEWAYSLGGGYRHLLPDQQVILGANAFYDRITSDRGFEYNQLGLGAEILTRWFDFRFNYFLPEDDINLIDKDHVGSEIEWDNPFAQGNAVFQDFREIETWRYLEEAALEGYYVEAGFLVPGLDKYMELRFFGGYYHYDSAVDKSYDGFKARAEARILPAIALDVEYVEDEEIHGGHWSGGVRVSVPFEIGNIFQGRNPFEGITDMFRPRQREFGERMTEMVIRSPRLKTPEREREKERVKEGTVTLVRDAVFANNDDGGGLPDGTGENPFSTIQEAVDYAGSNGFPNVVVFGGPTVYPENVVIDGFSLNLMGGGCIGNGGKTLSDHAIIDAGGGVGITALNAEQISISGFQIDNASVGIQASGVNDFEAYCNIINSATDYGILQLGGYRSYIHDNRLYGIGSANNGIDVRLSNTTGAPTNLLVQIADNFIDGGRHGIDVSVYSSTSGDVFDAIISGNTVSNSYDDGIYVATTGYNMQATVQVLNNDIFEPGSDAIHIFHSDSGTAGTGSYTDIVSGNYATGSGVPGDGVDISYYGSTASVFAQVTGNQLIDIFGTGIEIDYYSSTYASAGPGDFMAYVGQNTIVGGAPGSSTSSYGNRGIAITAYGYDYSSEGGGLNTTVDVVGNDISNVRDDGIFVYNYTYSSGSGGANGTFDVNVSGNTVSTSPVDEGGGIEIIHAGSGYGSGIVNVRVNNNTVNNTSSDNIEIDVNLYNYDSNVGMGDVSLWVNNNRLNMAPFGGDSAVDAYVYGSSYGGGADVKVWMNDNTIVGGTGAGLDFYANINADGSGTAGSFYAEANRNTITLNPNESQTAIEVDYYGSSYAGFANAQVMINDNVMDVGSGDGINVDVYSSYYGTDSTPGSMQLWVNNNRIDMTPTAGETAISGNLVGRSFGAPIDMDVWMNNNVMDAGTDNAVDFDVRTYYSGSFAGRGTTDVWFQNNRITTYDSGPEIDIYHSDYRDNPDGQDMNAWIQNNTIEGKGTGLGQLLDIAMRQYMYNSGSSSSVPTMNTWVQNNTMSFGSSGIEVDMYLSDFRVNTPGVSRNVWLSGNRVSRINGDAIEVDVYGYSSSGTVDVRIYDNVISAMDVAGTGTAFDIDINGASFDGSVAVYNNRVESWRSEGINIYYRDASYSTLHEGGGSFRAMIYDNQLTATSASNGDGIEIYGSTVNYSSALGGPDVTLDIFRNTVVGFEDSGIHAYYQSSNHGAGGPGSFTANVDDNTVSGGATFGDGDGIEVRVYGSDDTAVGGGLATLINMRNNTVASFSDSGLEINFYGYTANGINGPFTANVSGNRVSDVYDDGIQVFGTFNGQSGVGTVSILDNQIQVAGSGVAQDYGINVRSVDYGGSADFTATISGNQIEATPGIHGINVYVYDSGVAFDPSITADDNKISTVLDGLHIAYSGAGTMAFAGNRNDITGGGGAADDGFHFEELNGGAGEINLSGTDNEVTAGDLDVQADGNVTGTIYVNGAFLP